MLAGFLESLSVDVAEFGEQVCLDLSAGFLKKLVCLNRFFWLTSELAAFLWKPQNSAENTAEHYKFG